MAELEAKVESLRQALVPDEYFKRRNVRFRFLSPDAVEVIETRQLGHGRQDENELHDYFSTLRDLSQEWRAEHPEISVFVRLEVPHSFREDEFYFEREQQLD